MSSQPRDELASVLQALGSAAPNADLDTRILDRLAAPTIEKVKPGWSVFAPVFGFALIVAVAVASYVGHGAKPIRRPADIAAVSMASSPSAEQAVMVPEKQRGASPIDRPWPVTTPPQAPAVVRARMPLPRAKAEGELTASFPAPEMPLTEQERLLQHLARRPRGAEVELLSPDVRAAVAAEEDRRFAEFFPKPKLKENTNEPSPAGS